MGLDGGCILFVFGEKKEEAKCGLFLHENVSMLRRHKRSLRREMRKKNKLIFNQTHKTI